jgi:fumarate reductase subunit C
LIITSTKKLIFSVVQIYALLASTSSKHSFVDLRELLFNEVVAVQNLLVSMDVVHLSQRVLSNWQVRGSFNFTIRSERIESSLVLLMVHSESESIQLVLHT